MIRKYSMQKLILLFGLCILLGCQNNHAKLGNISPRSATSYLALGDSYTIGQSVELQDRWPVQLATALNEKGIPIEDPRIIAKTGWTTDELMSGIDEAQLTTNYDYVSLLIGVNNQYRGRSIENFEDEFIQLLEKAVEFSGNKSDHVFVLSIPDWGVTPFASTRNSEDIGTEIDAFNAVIEHQCRQRNIAYYNITPISRLAFNAPELLASDGLHPSALMYARWVSKVLPFFNVQGNE